jgi:WD40 repeat protein
VRFSPDWKKIVTVPSAFNDNTVTIWDAESGNVLRTLSYPNAAQFGGLQVAAFSPDGKRVITTQISGEGNVGRVWDAESGRELRTLTANSNVNRGNSFSLPMTSFSPDEKKFVTFDGAGNALVGEIGSGRILTTLTPPSRGNDFAFQWGTTEFSSDGKKLVTTGLFVRQTGFAIPTSNVRIWFLEP